jgi:hypothetical protein
MDDISNVPTGPSPSPRRPTRKSTGIEPSARPLFEPGRIEEGEGWDETESLQLSQEQAERLDENREPGDVKYVMKVLDDPEQYLRWRKRVIDASYVDYRRIHTGNLEDRLRLHTGEYDVPSGRTNPNVDYDGETPFRLNVDNFRLKLKKKQPVFQIMYYEWSYSDEDGGPGSSSMYSKRVEERPEGWVSVSEVSSVKDQTQSAITRAIRNGELTAVMQKSPQKRWIKPDDGLETWSPGRQANYLLRRRLKIMKETIYNQLDRPRGARILSLDEIMDQVRKKEIRRFGSEHTPESYPKFFEGALDHSPTKMRGWVKGIGALVAKYCRS